MSDTIPHADLLSEILAFCEARGVAKTIFGLNAVKDASFVADLEGGRECRRATIAKVRAYLQNSIQNEAGDAA